jgi:chromate reductase
MVKVLVLPGSARRESFNKKLAAVAAKLLAEAGAGVDLVDPAEIRMPLFDQDLEEAEGMPAPAKALKEKFLANDAILFVSPEYNSSITPLMKNMIDWVSRTETDGEPALSAYRGKVAGLISASPGALGGLRGLVHLRSILGNIGVTVIPKQFSLGSASSKFADDGSLKDSGELKSVKSVVEALVEITAKLKG